MQPRETPDTACMSLPELPALLAGPILRRVVEREAALWLATSTPGRTRISLHGDDGQEVPSHTQARVLKAGARLFLHLIRVLPETAFQPGRFTGYRVWIEPAGTQGFVDITDAALCHDGRSMPGFIHQPALQSLLHGSCRKPHFNGGGDGLARADAHLAHLLAHPSAGESWPSALVMSGDQVYCDDVAGPMLLALHRLAETLGLPDETLPGAEAAGVRCASNLIRHPNGLYGRGEILPRLASNAALLDLFFGGVRKPVFTSANAHNHLVTLAEVLLMVLLVWSPLPWVGLLDRPAPQGLDKRLRARWQREHAALTAFVRDLPAARRALAHVPTAMVFDDHDISDDWNLSREWEDAAYGHPLSRRIIGNALVGYLLGQAWGNRPEAFDEGLLDQVQQALDEPGGAAHDALIDRLLSWREWHYVWPTVPPLVVLDSRTHRWGSEVSPRQPSGLMDWEALTDLQQSLRGLDAVVLVASAPVFGVKLIETLQHLFSYVGRPLLVDAENWMSHPGAASAVLNIFRHPQTPQNFVILSGDVHYSFVYDVELRMRARRGLRGQAPHIWQLCSSGLRNGFPPRLLAVLDHLNRWLYSPRSPLNLFTRRRSMRVVPRKPVGTPHGRRLLVGSGIGLVELDAEGRPWRMRQLMADGRDVAFVPREAEARDE
jgi:hypothetical protein